MKYHTTALILMTSLLAGCDSSSYDSTQSSSNSNSVTGCDTVLNDGNKKYEVSISEIPTNCYHIKSGLRVVNDHYLDINMKRDVTFNGFFEVRLVKNGSDLVYSEFFAQDQNVAVDLLDFTTLGSTDRFELTVFRTSQAPSDPNKLPARLNLYWQGVD